MIIEMRALAKYFRMFTKECYHVPTRPFAKLKILSTKRNSSGKMLLKAILILLILSSKKTFIIKKEWQKIVIMTLSNIKRTSISLTLSSWAKMPSINCCVNIRPTINTFKTKWHKELWQWIIGTIWKRTKM